MNIKKRDKIQSTEVLDECCASDKYSECVCNIQSAIDCLCAVAENDEKAKDAIANLSVVLLDLKSE